jgi:threonine/homoserine/homoserine lactone efflux protein
VTDLTGFVALAIVVIVTPGPDTALTIRNTLVGGRPAGVATAFGVALGQATWSVATSIGVAALIFAAEPAFAALKLAGAAYLIYLGARSLWSAFRGRPVHLTVDRSNAGIRTATALRQGALSNLTNPKMAGFFPSLLPQFVTADARALRRAPPAGDPVLLHDACLAYGVRVRGRAGRRRATTKHPPTLDRGGHGVVLVAFGIRVAAVGSH